MKPVKSEEPDAGCEFEVCYDFQNAASLERNVRELIRYADEAWLLCGWKADGGG